MAPSSTGKWVSRVAATGGGRTYRGQVPVNWYAALVLIVILGIVSLVVARSDYQHPHKASSVQPAVGTTLYAGYAINICGTVQAALPASSNTNVTGITTPGDGVLDVSPTKASEAGNNATLGQFFTGYPGAELTATRLEAADKLYVNGQTCKAGTPDAGKKGFVKVVTWSNALGSKSTVVTGNPATLKIGSRSLIAIGFVPRAASLKKPGQTVVDAMLALAAQVVGGTTTTSTTTTVPSSTTTTVPSSTSTTTATTGTQPTGTTTTTKG